MQDLQASRTGFDALYPGDSVGYFAAAANTAGPFPTPPQGARWMVVTPNADLYVARDNSTPAVPAATAADAITNPWYIPAGASKILPVVVSGNAVPKGVSPAAVAAQIEYYR